MHFVLIAWLSSLFYNFLISLQVLITSFCVVVSVNIRIFQTFSSLSQYVHEMEANGMSESDNQFIDRLYDDIDKGKIWISVFLRISLNKNVQIYL